jgi:hypothetical protein
MPDIVTASKEKLSGFAIFAGVDKKREIPAQGIGISPFKNAGRPKC